MTAALIAAAPALAAPTVNIVLYSPAISGNIGVATARINVKVTLQRDGMTIDTAPTATTDSTGAWTARFPSHTPSDGFDILNVTYTGTGAPPNASYGNAAADGTTPGFGFFGGGMSIAPDGSTGEVQCNNFVSVSCASLTARVHYANGSTATVTGTPDTVNTGVDDLAFSPDVGINDQITIIGTFTEADGSMLSLSVPGPLPGVGDVLTSSGASAPSCRGDLVTLAVSCGPLSAGAYTLTQTRGSVMKASASATVPDDGDAASFSLASLEAGDVLALAPASPSGARTLTTLRVTALRVAEQETLTFGAGSTTITGGSCPPGYWLGLGAASLGGNAVCPPSGTMPSDSVASLEDDLSGSTTTATPPLVADISPLDGEDVSGLSIAAFADLTPASNAPVSLAAAPIGSGADPKVSGNANSTTGAIVAGLTPGTRYLANWTVTDANGDTVILQTHFVDQAGVPTTIGPNGTEGANGATGPQGSAGPAGSNGANGNPGANGAPGANGSAGAGGPMGPVGQTGSAGQTGSTGPRGTAGIGAEVVCTRTTPKSSKSSKSSKPSKPRMVTRCVVHTIPASGATVSRVQLQLRKGHDVIAVGGAAVVGGAATVTLHAPRPIATGRYALVIVTWRGAASIATRVTLR